jgi:hypothetical protein
MKMTTYVDFLLGRKPHKLLLAAVLACVASAASAQTPQYETAEDRARMLKEWGNPSRGDDPADRLYLLLKTVACGLGESVQRFAIWLPYDQATNKTLDFYRVTPQLPAVPFKGKIEIKEGNGKFPDVFLDGQKCERWPGQGQ